jgi:hypothetical protein
MMARRTAVLSMCGAGEWIEWREKVGEGEKERWGHGRKEGEREVCGCRRAKRQKKLAPAPPLALLGAGGL